MKYVKLLFLFFLFNISQSQKCDFYSFVNLTPKCMDQINEFIQEFTTTHPRWTQQMIDSTSRVPKGSATPNFNDFGDFDQCLAVSNLNGTIFGKYCLGIVVDKKNPVVDENSIRPPIWSLCLPNGCNLDDSTIVGNVVLSCLLESEDFSVEFSESSCQTLKDANPELTVGAIITIILLTCLTLVVVLSSFYEYYCTNLTPQSCPAIIKAFSLITNCRATFRMVPSQTDHLPCLNGLRFFSMMWVLIYHLYEASMFGPIVTTSTLIDWPKTLYSKLFINGALFVDTFLVISGTLLSYGFMKSRNRNQPFDLVRYYLHRYLRLIGPLALMVLITGTSLKYMGSGPNWPNAKFAYQQYCQEYWWSALLHVQNYVNPEQMCIYSSWYLMLDMQLYLFSPIVFFLLWKYPKTGLAFIGFCITGSMCWAFFTVWQNNLVVVIFFTPTNIYESIRTYTKYYYLTHLRASPWFIGVILGYFMFKIKHENLKFVLKKSVLSMLWVLSLGTLLVCVFIVQTFYGKEYDPLAYGLHAALGRTIWSLSIAWIILACTNNYGGPINWLLSLPIFQFFNKFIYSMYVVQETVILVVVLNKKYPDYFSDFQTAYDFWGVFFLCFGFAILMVLMVECPVAMMEKLLFKKVGATNKMLKFREDEGTERTGGTGSTDGTFRTFE